MKMYVTIVNSSKLQLVIMFSLAADECGRWGMWANVVCKISYYREVYTGKRTKTVREFKQAIATSCLEHDTTRWFGGISQVNISIRVH